MKLFILMIIIALTCYIQAASCSRNKNHNIYDNSFDPRAYSDPGWKENDFDLNSLVDGALKTETALRRLYAMYKVTHGVTHGHHETVERTNLFKLYLQRLKELEIDTSISWTPKITSMGHMTECEKNLLKMGNATHLESRLYSDQKTARKGKNNILQAPKLPESYDWRALNAVTPVKLQLADDCWAYAAVTTIEAQIKTLGGKLRELSTQELVDCVYREQGKRNQHPEGGGWPHHAYDHVKDEKRLGYRDDIFEREFTGSCSYQGAPNALEDNGVEIDEVLRIGHATAANIMAAVATISPVAVVIDTKDSDMEWYGEGSFDPRTSRCIPGEPHAVAIVGYDKDHFFIKNSWGPLWGNKGYFWWVRAPGKKDCNIYSTPSYPLIEKTSWWKRE